MRSAGSVAGSCTLGSLMACGSVAAEKAGDLSAYRSFRFETDLATELEWRPRLLSPSTRPESAGEIVFGFFEGSLHRIEVTYDRYQIEGLTSDDIVAAISAVYGSTTLASAAMQPPEGYAAPDVVAARWEDSQYRFELVHSSLLNSFKLMGLAQRLDSRAAEQDAAAARRQKARAARTSRDSGHDRRGGGPP